MPHPRCQTKVWTYNQSEDKILKVSHNTKIQVEAKSNIQKIITEVLIV